jgi:hypothetical protein
VDLLAGKLRAFQRYVEEVAKRSRPAGVGLADARRASRLGAIRARPGSLVVEMELPAVPCEGQLLEPVDLGDVTADRATRSIGAIAARSITGLAEVFPNPGDQVALLRAARALIPEPEADYGLAIDGRGDVAALSGAHQEWVCGRLGALETDDREQQVRSVVGTLVRVDASGPMEAGVRSEGARRPITCRFDADLLPVVVDISIGEVVEARGHATLASSGRVMALDPMTDIAPVQTGFQTVSRVEVGDRRFVLEPVLLVEVVYRDGMVWREYPSLEIWACGATRAEARADFAEEFARLYDHYTGQDEGRLSDGALALRRELKRVVKREESVQA